ncbi:MAG: DUF4292 domain-containing protein [Cytophagales bacterium]|nr:DUF4292 domain-containing protein [Cytophagales bacterium]
MNKFLFILFILFLFSCKRQQVKTIDRLNINELQFENFIAKSKVSFTDKNKHITLNTSIRIRKDSVIWISASIALGIEVARVVITTDSIFILDKFNKNYYAMDIRHIAKKVSAKAGNPVGIAISYDLLQDLILGNMPFYASSAQNKLIKEADHYLIRQEYDRYIIDNYINKKSRKLEKLKLYEQSSNNVIELDYNDFKKLGKSDFAYSNIIRIFYEQNNKPVYPHMISPAGGGAGDYKSTLRISYKKVSISTKRLNFPFRVPPRYKKLDIGY